MRRTLLPFILIFCLLFSGCGSGSRLEKNWLGFSGAASCSTDLLCTAEIRAEYENKTVKFSLSYADDGNTGTVTVDAPKIIQGISATVDSGTTRLCYDSVILDTGDLDDFGLSPMSALPVIVRAIRSGHLESCWTEDGKAVYQLKPDDRLLCTLWLEESSMTPMRAEIISQGRVCIYIDFKSWQLS